MRRVQQMKPRIPATILALLLLSGCHLTRDQMLSPKPEAGTIKVTIKVPEELVARDMKVIYRSTKCTWTSRSMLDGEKLTRDSYTTLNSRPVHNSETGLSEAKLAVDGGGKCNWRLSSAFLGVEYKDSSTFGDGVEFGVGGELVVEFDETDSAYGGPNTLIISSPDGTLSLSEHYYPWLSEGFVGGHRKTIHLKRKGYSVITLRAPNVHTIHFEPILHSGHLVRSVGPMVKQKGVRSIFYYPDGSHSMESRGEPSFQKLEAIRQAAERHQ